MAAIDHELDRLKLTAIRDQLDSLLDEAARSKMTLREALAFLIEREIARRDERRISMASKIAQFPFVRELSGFEFDAQPSLDPGQIRELATCRWIAHGDTTLLLGPPGTGKTQVSIATPGSMPRGSRSSIRLRRSDRGSDPVPGMTGTGS
jgi:DNA replication protein DnaC